MSVYTTIDREELEQFLDNYNQGELTDYQGISSGIENTNYFVNTGNGQFVLTIFEHHTADELPFFLDLTAFLSEHNIPCAHPVADKQECYLTKLKNKPAAMVQRLAGTSIDRPNKAQCIEVGRVLAKMHVAGQSFDQKRDNGRGPRWWQQTASKLDSKLLKEDRDLLAKELDYQARRCAVDLPRGIIHADLFRDNVLFSDDRLSGLIDFYYACTDLLLYDIAVAVNDWCVNADGVIDQPLAQYLLDSYQKVRPLSDTEQVAYPAMLRAAALRFWLSRLHDLHFPREGEITHTKDPQVFRRILVNHRQQAET